MTYSFVFNFCPVLRGLITNKVEEIKAQYTKEIEALKLNLSLIAKKQNALFDEEVKAFKKLKEKLSSTRRYCVAAQGSLGYGGEFHPNFESLSEADKSSGLVLVREWSDLISSECVYINNRSRVLLENLQKELSLMPSVEIATNTQSEQGMITGAISYYQSIVTKIDDVLLEMFNNLKSEE